MRAMSWLHSLDVAIFRFINETLSNPLFDRCMLFFSGNSLFVPFLIVVSAVLVWIAGVRGRLWLIMVVLVVCLGRFVIVDTIKHNVVRLLTFNNIPIALARRER